MYRLALSQTREPADASDVCQETFISLLKDATVFQDDEDVYKRQGLRRGGQIEDVAQFVDVEVVRRGVRRAVGVVDFAGVHRFEAFFNSVVQLHRRAFRGGFSLVP